jgi:hypothetical protein
MVSIAGFWREDPVKAITKSTEKACHAFATIPPSAGRVRPSPRVSDSSPIRGGGEMHFDLNGFGRRRSSVSASLLVLLSVTIGSAMTLLAIVPLS